MKSDTSRGKVDHYTQDIPVCNHPILFSIQQIRMTERLYDAAITSLDKDLFHTSFVTKNVTKNLVITKEVISPLQCVSTSEMSYRRY